MTAAFAFDLALVALVLAVALSAVAARDVFASVVGFVACGLLLTLLWVRIGAVDVALIEAAIGSGLTGGLLIAAAKRLRSAEAAAQAERTGVATRAVAAALGASVAIALGAVVLLLPEPAPTLADDAAAHLAPTGLGNAVTAVLMVYRSLDTLLEKVVLTLALIGVWALAPDAVWGGRPGLRRAPPDREAIGFHARVLPPIGIVVALYVFWVSADEPGGAFQGGAILAAMWILAIRAGILDAPALGRRGLRVLLVFGAALFLAVGFAGVFLAGAFLAYPGGWAKPLLLAIEGALIVSIAGTLGLLVLGPAGRPESR